MKNIIIYTFIFLLANQKVLTQPKTYFIKYEFSLDNFENSIISDPETKDFRDFFIDLSKNDRSISFELQIEGDRSYFKDKKQLLATVDKNTLDLEIIRGLSYKGNWLTDLKNSFQIMINDNQGNKYYVGKSIKKRVWILSNVSKNILGFKCYKATSKEKTPKGIEYTVTAWYTNDIPLQFGPVDYGGQLPGLILEVHDLTSIYTATQIKNIKKFSIVWPNEKDIITEDAYNKEGNKVMDFYKKMN